MASSEVGVTVDVEMVRGERLNSVPYLWKYDKQLSLADNIRKIIVYHNTQELEPLPVNGQYALKVVPDARLNRHVAEHFIAEASVDDDIGGGYHLKLVPGVQQTVRGALHRHDNELLLQLSYDRVAIEEVVRQGRHGELVKLLLAGTLDDDGESGALNILLHLLQNGYVHILNDSLVVRIAAIAQQDTSASCFAISLLVYILRTNREALSQNKTTVMQHVKVSQVMRSFQAAACSSNIDFYQRVFCLINELISSARLNQRSAILFELDSSENRCLFYEFLLAHEDLCDSVARQVFVLQARLLTYSSLYSHRSAVEEDPSRYSGGSEYDNADTWVSSLERTESTISMLSVASVSMLHEFPLLAKCLEYGKQVYRTYFDSLAKSDYACESELHTIAQNILRVLTDLLCVGCKLHAHSFYLPMFFAPVETNTSCGVRTVAFFEELFVKTLMLLFRTKAEMRVKTKEDFKKLYRILRRQLVLVFEKRPLDFTHWDAIIADVTYSVLQEIEQKERDERWRRLYAQHPSVRQLAADFSPRNRNIIGLTRMHLLQKGFTFRNMHTRNKFFSLALLPDCGTMLYAECTRNGTHIVAGRTLCLPIANIKHIVHGENCSLRVHNQVTADKSNCVFTISYESPETTARESIDCYFNKERDSTESEVKDMATLAEYWKDGLNLLIGTSNYRSERMDAELEELNELDCKLQLIELQNVEIPLQPPPVPTFEVAAMF